MGSIGHFIPASPRIHCGLKNTGASIYPMAISLPERPASPAALHAEIGFDLE
jgi:hypothetical protein